MTSYLLTAIFATLASGQTPLEFAVKIQNTNFLPTIEATYPGLSEIGTQTFLIDNNFAGDTTYNNTCV